MGFRMRNFNIMGVHWKLQFLGGIQYIGGNCLKGGLGKFPGLRGDLAENSAVFT